MTMMTKLKHPKPKIFTKGSLDHGNHGGKGSYLRETGLEHFLISKEPFFSPNVCKSEEEIKLKQQNDLGIFNFFQSSSCVNTGKSYRCSAKTRRNNTNYMRTLTYECCFGFNRQNGQKGCPNSELKLTCRDKKRLSIMVFRN